jgi:SAM-dependent methyltransferase
MSSDAGDAAEHWRAELAAWAIPDEILAAAPESPYGFPVALFAADASPDAAADDTPSRRRALEALPEGGSVLDVGCGGGRASFALVPPAGLVVGVDSSEAMLTEYAAAAQARGVEHREVVGVWPDVADRVEATDVVVAHHVVYNVPDLVPFVRALTRAARARVVLELTDRHPWVATNALWLAFHGLERPAGPTASLAADVVRSVGLPVRLEHWQREQRRHDRAETVRLIRRRLCLPASADEEIDRMLPADYEFVPRAVTTMWWDVGGDATGA